MTASFFDSLPALENILYWNKLNNNMSNPAFETESIDINDNPSSITDDSPHQNVDMKSDPEK
jgi:hypothetical protein